MYVRIRQQISHLASQVIFLFQGNLGNPNDICLALSCLIWGTGSHFVFLPFPLQLWKEGLPTSSSHYCDISQGEVIGNLSLELMWAIQWSSSETYLKVVSLMHP